MPAHPDPETPATPKKVPLRGSDRVVRPSFHATGPAPPDQPIRVVVKVRPQNPLPDPDVLGAIAPVDRPAPSYAAHVARHGATPEEVAAVVQFAQSHGLTVVESDPNLRMVVLAGTTRAFEAAFQTSLQTYKSASGETYRGRTGPVHVPENLQDVITVVAGLDDRRQAGSSTYPRADHRPRAFRTVFYTPTQLASLYDFPTGLDGSGQCIGLLEFDGGYKPADLQYFFNKVGVKAPTVVSVSADGTMTNTPGSGADGEVVLDIEVAGGAAPGAKIAVYFAPFTEAGWVEAITKAVHDTTNKPSVLSISWGWSELQDAGSLAWTAQVMNEVNRTFAEAANLGITVIAAAGDDGSIDGIEDGKVHVDFPSSSPYVLGCGGTTLRSTNGKITSEVVWSGGTRQSGTGTTGGGVSEVFPKPAWQTGPKLNVPKSASTGFVGRGVPDVAADADAQTGYYIRLNGKDEVSGGTSAATPLWAALVARINQKLATLPGGKTVGYINPLLYQQIGPTAAFHDITSGTNDADGNLHGAYNAGPGWDACTGWGSPDGAQLLAALSGTATEPTEAAGGAAVIGMEGANSGNAPASTPPSVPPADELAAERESNRLLIETVHRLVGLLGQGRA